MLKEYQAGVSGSIAQGRVPTEERELRILLLRLRGFWFDRLNRTREGIGKSSND